MRVRAMSCVLALLLAMAGNAFAQQGTTEIRGKVTDGQGAAIPGASVTISKSGHRHVPRDGERR